METTFSHVKKAIGCCIRQGILNYDPDSPQWMNRDRFVLSMGHASMLLYGLLHVAGVKEVTKVPSTKSEPLHDKLTC